MAYSVSDIKSELNGVLHGTTINQVTGPDVLISRAARTLVADFDPMETIRIAQVSPFLFDQVYDYTCPSDLKGDRIIDIRPQVNRTPDNRFSQLYNEDFDANKGTPRGWRMPSFTVQWNNAVKTLRIDKSLIAPLLVNSVSSITDNGTWAAGGNASNLVVDTINYVDGGGSLRFDVSAGGAGSTAYLENSTMTAVDLSRDVDQGTEFLWVYFPDATEVTNVILRWGSSSANYWTVTATSAFNSTAFQNGWNLLSFSWNGATEVGTPDDTAVNYARLTVTYDGSANTDYRFNSLTSQLGAIYEIEYYSKFLFRSSAGTFQETVLDDSDLINLDTDSYNVFFSLVALYCAQQIQGQNSSFDLAFFQQEYDKQKKRYVEKIKSQTIRPQSTYYSMPRTRYVLNRN